MTKNEELGASSFIKAVMMIAVVLYHSCVIFTGTWGIGEPAVQSAFFGALARWMSTVHIYAFTFVSGYIFYYTKYEAGKYKTFRELLSKKASRLLLPYVCVSILWAIPFNLIFFDDYNLRDIAEDFVLCKSPAQLWFVVKLFAVFVLFFALGKVFDFSKQSNFAMLIFAAVLYLLPFVVARFTTSPVLQLYNAANYSIYFFLGMCFRRYSPEKLYKPCRISVIGIAYFGLYTALRVLPDEGLIHKLSVLLRPFVIALGVLFFVLLLGSVSKRIKGSSGIGKLFFGNSFVIYLLHQQIIYVVISLFNHPKIPAVLLVSLNFVLSLLVSTVMSVVLGRFSVTRKMFGFGNIKAERQREAG